MWPLIKEHTLRKLVDQVDCNVLYICITLFIPGLPLNQDAGCGCNSIGNGRRPVHAQAVHSWGTVYQQVRMDSLLWKSSSVLKPAKIIGEKPPIIQIIGLQRAHGRQDGGDHGM